MANSMKKALIILLAICMLMSLTIAAFAEETTNVARIGETEYATLADAVAAANADTTEGAIEIELIANTTFSSALTIKRNITIRGAYTITRAADYTSSFATVNKGATLTLDGGLVIDGNNNWSFDSENFYADMKAGLTLSTGAKNSYTTSKGANATAALIKINAGGAAVMNNATIQNCWADNRNNGALFSVPAGATLTTNEGSVINHIHASVAGQVSGTWTMNGGKINDVYGHNSNGGLVDIRNSGVVTINGGEITNVRTLGLNANGNGIIAQVYGESAKLYMKGGYIHDNASFAPGGGWGAVVYLNRGGDFFMTGGTIKITESNKCSAFVANTATTIELTGGTMVVEPSTAASFDSLIYGDVTIGEDMEIICDLDSLLPIVGDDKYTAVINGEINGTGTLWVLYNKPVTGEGTVTTNVLIKADPSYFGFDGKVILDGANWLDSIITVDSIGSDASLTVTPKAYIDGVQIRVLDSVESGDYTNAAEAAAAQAAAYLQQEGATVKSPVLFFHRLTSAQKSDIVVTFDYNGGLDAQNWSGCQLTSAEAFAPACPTPTKEGYVFAGWAYAENNEPETLSMATTGAYNGEEIAQSLRLVAQWREPDYVCYIEETGVYYETLAEAVAVANELEGANTIVMIKSIDFDSAAALTVTGELTIKGEYTISRGAYTGTLFTVPAGSSLTLDGGIVFDGSNNWIFEKELYENDLYNFIDNPISSYAYSAEGGTCGTAAVFVVNGNMTVKNATIQNFFNTKDSNAGDGAIFKVNANATLTTDGATIDHVATYGANAVAHLASGSTWNIMGNTMISNNFAGRNGGVCRNDSGVINMSGGTIKDNAGKNVNGTVFMMYGTGSKFIMTGGTICHNSSVFGANNGRCAAVYLHANSYMQMTGGTICHNIGGSRGGIDSYKSSSVLDINRVDQEFDNAEWKESGEAAYNASNHPMIVDNVSLLGYASNDVGHSFNFETWWVTGGIYTQDVDEFCAPGYVCIPYEDSERTDDYIVVPGYRVNYYTVSTVEVTDEETGEVTTETVTTLVAKRFVLLDRDKFWYEVTLYAENLTIIDEENSLIIDKWYTEAELTNLYDFETALSGDLDLFGTWEEYKKCDCECPGCTGEEIEKPECGDKDHPHKPGCGDKDHPHKPGCGDKDHPHKPGCGGKDHHHKPGCGDKHDKRDDCDCNCECEGCICNKDKDEKPEHDGCHKHHHGHGCHEHKHDGCQKPEQDNGCQKPEQGNGCQKPQQDNGCQKPQQDNGCQKPQQGNGCNSKPSMGNCG